MKRLIPAAVLAMLTLAHAPSFAPAAAGASEGKQETKVEEGFTSLFNGKDLTGWVYGNMCP